MWNTLPDLLRAYSNQPNARVQESLPTGMLWAALGQLPSFEIELQLGPGGGTWFAGGRGVADLTRRTTINERPQGQCELKSHGAAWNATTGPDGRPAHQLQTILDAAAGTPVLIVAPTAKAKRIVAGLKDPAEMVGVDFALRQAVRVMNFAEVGDALERALVKDGLPVVPFLVELFDVD